MATPARKIQNPAPANAANAMPFIEENGVVRSTVFPNRLRDVRREKDFESLTEFHAGLGSITYSRLAKIERGQIFPRADELITIAKHLDVEPDDLLIDVTDPTFDREAWAKENVEASLAFRGGNLQDMRIGAALRLKRHELGRSTTDMKRYGLPAATVSRIENADRPFDRWAPDIVQGVKKVFGVNSMVKLMEKVEEYKASGELDEMMQELFSTDTLRSRQAGPFAQLATAIPGEKGRKIARSLQLDTLVKKTELTLPQDAISTENKLPVYGGISLCDGSLALHKSEETFSRRKKAQALAIRPDRQILGPLDLKSVMIFEKIDRSKIEESMVIAVLRERSVMIGSVHKMGRGFRFVQTGSEASMSLSQIDGTIMKMVQVAYPE